MFTPILGRRRFEIYSFILCHKFLIMNRGRMTFSQTIDFAYHDIFKICVNRYKGNYKTKEFSCWKQFLCLAFGQLNHRESMSDTMLCQKLNADKFYHPGIGKAVNKCPLSSANKNRDWHIFSIWVLS